MTGSKGVSSEDNTLSFLYINFSCIKSHHTVCCLMLQVAVKQILSVNPPVRLAGWWGARGSPVASGRSFQNEAFMWPIDNVFVLDF